jgi:uncharacterized membrane protein (DUF106 family)
LQGVDLQSQIIINDEVMNFLVRVVICWFALAMITPAVVGLPQENKVNQKKIERERAKKNKKARKEYKKAVDRHVKMQSKTTKASMKRTKKEAAKITPSRH